MDGGAETVDALEVEATEAVVTVEAVEAADAAGAEESLLGPPVTILILNGMINI